MGNKTTPGPIFGNVATLARTVTAADTPPLNDTACDPTTACTMGGWRRVKVYPRFMGGTNPTCAIQVLHRVSPVNGNGWVPGPLLQALVDGQATDLEVFGRDVFFAVTAITGSPTGVGIYAAGWEPVNQQGGPHR